jgi:1,4-dihydroxy-2-naphthoyl-CoA hydrolase
MKKTLRLDMFRRKKILRLYESDSTGVIYFPQQLRMAQEQFETYLEHCDHSLGESLKRGELLLPVVHVEGDYLGPIQVGDELEIALFAEKIGTSSFTLGCHFTNMKTKQLVGTTSIVHVALDRKAWTSIPIPEHLLKILQALQVVEEKALVQQKAGV